MLSVSTHRPSPSIGLPIDQQYTNALMAEEKYTIKSFVDESYLSSLREWVDSAPEPKRCHYQAVAINILQGGITGDVLLHVSIDCSGLDTLPPLPTHVAKRKNILLFLKGEPDVALDVFLTHLPNNVVALTLLRNTAIQTLSSAMVPASVKKLSINNCPNLAYFFGEFTTLSELTICQIAGRSLSFLKDNFPELCHLCLFGNANLELIEVSENFQLRRLEIRGDHNKLTAIPPFVGLKEIDLNASGLASISDYSWGYDAIEGFKCNEYAVIDLVAAHHRQGKPAATLKLIEMAEHILVEGKIHSQEFAMRCIGA